MIIIACSNNNFIIITKINFVFQKEKYLFDFKTFALNRYTQELTECFTAKSSITTNF
jgi:hypothetical protein